MESGYGGSDGTLNDLERIDYLTKYIAGTLKAIRYLSNKHLLYVFF
jgi:beta-glucosidase